MDFQDSPEEAAFRAEARKWLETAAAEFRNPPATPYSDEELVAKGRAWQRKKAEGGFAGIHWPKSMGGRGGSGIEAMVFGQEEHRYHIPTGPFIGIGMGMAVPTINKHGTPEQAERFTRPTLKGEMTWCQLFSEPGAGSDLAGLRTRATRDGDKWIVNGQKVWSSWAHHADFGILLARTDPSVPKHKGITFFVLDMKTPGITIRPIRQISGKSDFNEVFFENVVIPDTNRIGAEGEGWACAMTVLMNERAGSGGGGGELSAASLIAELAKRGGGSIDSVANVEKLARWHTIEQGLKNFQYRLQTSQSKKQPLGAEAALVKLAFSRKLQELSAFAMDIDGYAGLFPSDDVPRREIAAEGFIWSSAMRIAGGADEVLRNQLAERVLGMPGEIRMDRDVPFEKLSVS